MTDPLQLLRQLEPAVRPGFAPGAAGAPPTPALEHERFDVLLSRAQGGTLGTGRPVHLDAATGAELSPTDRARLEAAADLAEANGARRAVLLLDGRGLLLDVPGRRVTGELAAQASPRIADVDTAIFVDR